MKKIYNASIFIIIWTTAFWFIYTVVNQFIDGWHWGAVSQAEKLLDIISSIGWRIGLILWAIAVCQLVHGIMNGVDK